MNGATKVAANWAFIAGLLNAGNANFFVNCQGKLFLAFYVDKGLRRLLEPWLKGLRTLYGDEPLLKPEFGRGKVSTRIRVRFTGSEAAKIAAMTDDYLFDARLKAAADLARRWWQTVQKRGFSLTDDQRQVRESLLREFEKLKRTG